MTTPETTPTLKSDPATNGRRAWWFGAVAGIVLVGLGVVLVSVFLPGMLSRSDLDTTETRPPAEVAPPVEAQRTIHATVFYLSADRTELVAVSRDVAFGATPVLQARRIVEAQIASPPEGHVSTIPAGTTVRSVFVTADGRAFVDLGGTIISGHAGGSLNEALTVYALVNSLTVSLPDVTSVQILVDGAEVDSLTGHLDLRSPLGRSLRWIQRGQ